MVVSIKPHVIVASSKANRELGSPAAPTVAYSPLAFSRYTTPGMNRFG